MTYNEYLLSIPDTRLIKSGWVLIKPKYCKEHMNLFVYDGNHIFQLVKASENVTGQAAIHGYGEEEKAIIHVMKCVYVRDVKQLRYNVGLICENYFNSELILIGKKVHADVLIKCFEEEREKMRANDMLNEMIGEES